MESNNELVKLKLEDIVSPNITYLKCKFKEHFSEFGIVIGKTPTNFIQVSDLNHKTSYYKISEIQKIITNKQ